MQMLTKSIDQFFSAVDDEEETKKKNESEGKEGEAQKFSLESPFERFKKSQTSSSNDARANGRRAYFDVRCATFRRRPLLWMDRLWLLFV